MQGEGVVYVIRVIPDSRIAEYLSSRLGKYFQHFEFQKSF